MRERPLYCRRKIQLKIFLLQEAQMNAYILKHISEKFPVPAEKFNYLYDMFEASDEDLRGRLRAFFGDYSGQIYQIQSLLVITKMVRKFL